MFNYPNIIYEDNKPGEAKVTLCKSSLAKEILNWIPKKNITDYIKSLNER